jgi:hypothetical protein
MAWEDDESITTSPVELCTLLERSLWYRTLSNLIRQQQSALRGASRTSRCPIHHGGEYELSATLLAVCQPLLCHRRASRVRHRGRRARGQGRHRPVGVRPLVSSAP